MRCLPIFCAAIGLTVASCKPRDYREFDDYKMFVERGVTYLVRWESGNKSTERGIFRYDGKSVTASEEAGNLTVNGKPVGKVKAGDTVDLRYSGKVLVNGKER